jgi:uncharacterized damage-inducible protein DinB
MRAEEAKTVADALLSTIESEIPVTTSVFEAVPPDKVGYAPDPVSKTALGLIRHLTLEDEWFLNSLADGNFGDLPDDSDACGIMTPQDAVTRYRERVPAAIARVRALSGEDLLKKLDLLGLMQMPGIDFLSLAVRHTAHHRGQLSTYLRPMGAKVPSIYGPSADTWKEMSQPASA